MIFILKDFETEASLFPQGRNVRPKLRITVFHRKSWKTGNIMLDWQGGIEKRMTLEDGETDEFLLVKSKKSH